MCHSEPLALSSIQLTLTQKKAKFLVLSFFTLSVPYLLFTVVSYPLSISMTYHPCKPPLQTHKYNLVLPSLVCFKLISFGHLLSTFPPHRDTPVSSGFSGDKSSLLPYHQEREERSSLYASSHLPQTWSSSKSSGRRQYRLHLLGRGSERMQFAPVHKAKQM